MKLLLYQTTTTGLKTEINGLVAKYLSPQEIEIVTTTEALAKRLGLFRNGLEIGLLLISGLGELKRLVAMGGLFSDLALILLLPNRDRHLISQALKLYPRYIAFPDEELHDIEAVVAKMISVKRAAAI